MEKTESLKEVERRAYRSTFEDGIYDIQFGLLFLILAWIAILETIGISRFIGYSLLLIPIALPWPCKRYITIPRMGSVQFGPKRKSRRRLILVIAGLVIVLTLPLMIMFAADGGMGSMSWLMISALAFPVFVIAVYSMDFPRLYIYAALLVFGVVSSEFLVGYVGAPFNTIISFGLSGLIIFIVGLSLLVGFIRKYPKPTPEVNHAGR
jgi:hypothetical protein